MALYGIECISTQDLHPHNSKTNLRPFLSLMLLSLDGLWAGHLVYVTNDLWHNIWMIIFIQIGNYNALPNNEGVHYK